MSKARIYTRTGDSGETGMVGGTRLSKDDDRIALYGEVDELNSRIGWAISCLARVGGLAREIADLEAIQSSLFALGSNLACEPDKRAEWKLPSLSMAEVGKLERDIDRMEASLPELKNFVLPGGSDAAAALHLCRTGTRRVERLLVSRSHKGAAEAPEYSVAFINRLSDYFFVLARWVNKSVGVVETPWKPS